MSVLTLKNDGENDISKLDKGKLLKSTTKKNCEESHNKMGG